MKIIKLTYNKGRSILWDSPQRGKKDLFLAKMRLRKRSFFLLCLTLSSLLVGNTFASGNAKIISLAPDLTELVYSLGLEKQLVATTEFSNYPLAAKKIPSVGSFISPNIEKIILLKPTVVLARKQATPQSVILFLQKENIEILSFSAQSETDIFLTLNILGKKFNKTEKAKEIISHMKERLKKIQDKLALKGTDPKGVRPFKPRVLIQIEENPFMVAGSDTLVDRAIHLAGGINAAGQYRHYPKLQREMALKLNPDIIIVPRMGRNTHKAKRMVKQWQKSKKAHLINGDLVTRASLRFIDGIELLFNLIHIDSHVGGNDKKG